MKMIIEDLIILGRTEPQQTKTSGITVCTAGYSKELRQFVRIYPLAWGDGNIKRWDMLNAPLRRNNKDSRIESWRVNCSKEESACKYLTKIGKADKIIEFDYLDKQSTTIDELNAKRLSLGIIKPDGDVSISFDTVKNTDNPNQMNIFDYLPSSVNKNFVRPRLNFTCNDKPQHIRLDDWGCYEYLRKNPQNIDGLKNALNLNDDYEHLFFVGNLNAIRTAWIIISVISRKKPTKTSLFDL